MMMWVFVKTGCSRYHSYVLVIIYYKQKISRNATFLHCLFPIQHKINEIALPQSYRKISGQLHHKRMKMIPEPNKLSEMLRACPSKQQLPPPHQCHLNFPFYRPGIAAVSCGVARLSAAVDTCGTDKGESWPAAEPAAECKQDNFAKLVSVVRIRYGTAAVTDLQDGCKSPHVLV